MSFVADRDAQFRRRAFLAAVALPFLYGFGVYMYWPLIVPEFARREPWEIAMGGAEDVVAAYWYLRFLASYVFSPDVGHADVTAAEAISQWRRVIVSMVCGAALSALSIALVFHTEQSSYTSASKTTGQAYLAKRMEFTDLTHYRLDCHFTDALGAPHVLTVTIIDRRNNPSTEYPAQVLRDLHSGRWPFAIPIRYDPARPARAWIDGAGGVDSNSNAYYSLIIVFFQLLGLATFATMFLPALRACARRGVIP